MKKKYSTPNLIKAVTLSAAMATLLSSVSPIFAANLSIRGSLVQSTTGPNVLYTYGSHGSIVLAGDDNYCGADNVVGRGGRQQNGISDSQRISAEDQYKRFVDEKTFQNRSPYGTTTEQKIWVSDGVTDKGGGYMGTPTFGIVDAVPEAFGIYSFATGCGSSATGNYSTAFGAGATTKAGGAQAFGVSALAGGIASVAMGVGSEASGKSTVAIGGLATALGTNSIALGTKVKAEKNYTIAIGTDAEAKASGSIAIGGRRSDRTEEHNPNRQVIAKAENAIAIGTQAYAETEDSVAIGVNSQVLVKDGVAVGGGSISDRAKGGAAYDPATGKDTTKTDIAWKSTAGAFSVGEVIGRDGKGQLTRQITGVAAGKEDTDAVNVAQLKAISAAASGAWKLGVNDEVPIDVNPSDTVKFVAVKKGQDSKKSQNINITKDGGHTVKFDLADNITVSSVTAGQSSISGDGFFIGDNGPKMILDGIDAGDKVITNVANGTQDDHAVNYKQLSEVRTLAEKGWKLSVDGRDSTDVKAGSTVNFASGEGNNSHKNINITKDGGHTVKFDLADDINVMTVKAGESVMDASGFRFDGGEGPSIAVTGIHAGDKTIKGVANGTLDNDAVNVSQLEEVKTLAQKGWKLSVNGNSNSLTDVASGSTVDFSVKNYSNNELGKDNLKIEKDNQNNIKFALSDKLELTSVTTGNSFINDEGFSFIDGNGPKMTVRGIDAGDKVITNVEDGTQDDHAVNYKQLSEVKVLAENGWKLSVDGEDPTDVKAGNTVNLVAYTSKDGSKNIKIKKDSRNNIKFSLNDNLKLTSITTGNSIMSYNGFEFVDGGPSVTENGIDAGDKRITGVEDGKDDTDAVNFSQLNKIKDQIEGNSLVKWDEKKQRITIGAQKDGVEINVANKSGDNRTISGVKDGGLYEASTDAVNGSQLWDTNKKVELLYKKADTISNTVVDLGKTVYNIETKVNNVAEDAVRYDRDESGQKTNKITLRGGDTSTSVSITNIADGFIKGDSKDAINGSQINTISGDIAKFFGGNAAFQDGAFVGPNYNLSKVSTDGTVVQHIDTNVGDALTTLDLNVRNVNSRIKYVDNKFDKFSQDALLWDDGKKAFSARHKKDGSKTDSKITSLLNGDVREDSTDAINGSQLYSMGSDIASYFGGGAGYDEKGEWHAPTFNVYTINGNGSATKQPYRNVAEAFEGVNNTFANIHNQISDITKNSLVKWDEDEKLITIGAEKDGVEINISNKDEKPRVISGVREGLYDDEAVNVAQLKEVKELAKNGWKLSVNDDENNVTDVKAGSTVDFSVKDTSKEGVGKDNLKIEKDDKNQVIFSLNDNLKLTSVTTDNSTMSDDGFIIKNGPHMTKDGIFVNDNDGPSMTMEGIDAGKKVIKNVAEGKNDTDAVNFSQLQGIKNQIENDSLVKWEEEKKLITIGKEKGGTTINITNKDNQPRLIVGVADGKISDGSKDAINGSQINKISEDIAKFFGGGAKFVDGAFKGLKYTLSAIVDGQVGKANFYDVGSALTGLDKNVQDVNQRLTKVSNEFNQTIEGISKDALLWDDEEQAFVARHEKDGKKTKSKLKYLLDGEIANGSTDAITGNQLYFMSNKLANYFGGGAKYENGKWTDPTFKIVQVNADGTTVEKNHNNVADAFGDVNKNMSNINNRIDDVINKVDSDALKWNEDKKAYDANRGNKPSKITGVADGKVEQGSKDAVNGGQLWKTNERVTNVENRVTSVEKDVKHLNNKVDNISNTIEDIGGTITNIDNKVNNIAEDAVRYDRDENGKKTNKITLAGGDASEPVLIDNVADGKIEKGSKEAVNGGQLHDYTKEQTKLILDESKQYTDQRIRNITIDAIDDAVERAKQYTDMRFDVLNYSIESVKKEARQAAAIGLAVSNLRYNDTPGKLSVGFGAGLWRSQSAFAFGAGYTSENGKYRSNISATTSGGHWGVGAGFNMTLN